MNLSMNQTLLKINKIKNLESVKIYDLTSFKLYDTRKYVLPAMIIRYDGGKYLNLYANDPYFCEYVLKVQEVYLREKDKTKIDKKYSPLVEGSIDIDPVSEKILLEGNLNRKNSIYDFYSGKKNYDYSLFFEKDDMKFILPMVRYHLKEFMNDLGIMVNYKKNDNLSGYKHYYAIDALVNGLEDKLLFSFDKKDNGYFINVRSMSRNIPNSIFTIIINTDHIEIESKILFKDIIEEFTYDFINEPSIEKNIYKDGQLISYDKRKMDKRDKLAVNLPILDDYYGTWYKFPWGDWFGIEEKITQIGELEKVTKRDSKYLTITDDGFMMHDDYSKKWVKDKGINAVSNSMVLDKIKKTVKCKRIQEAAFLLETHILDNTVPYNDKYFYHVTECNKIEEITKDSLVSISKDNNLIYSGDLYDSNNINLVLRKKVNNGNN